MKRLFFAQKCASIVYILMTVIVAVYTLAFMTQYSDLAGLKLPQNALVSNFYTSGLQVFNRIIFAWALLAVVGIALIFFLELRTRVPDRFALVVMVLCLGLCSYGGYFAIYNILEMAGYYGRLNFDALALEGGAAVYELQLATLQAGVFVYLAQILVCVAFAAILIASHVTYKKLEKRGEH